MLRAASLLIGALPAPLAFRLAAVLRRRQARGRALRQRLRGGTQMMLEVGDHPQGVAFFSRRWEPNVVDYIVASLPAGGTFIDVGAHVGLITFQVAQRRPDCRIVAFEPEPRNAARWEHNRRLNAVRNAALSPLAVSDSAGVAAFFVGGQSGWNLLDPEGGQRVTTTTLDGYCREHAIERVDVLKLDIEGGEPAALRGAAELLAAGRIGAVVAEVEGDMRARIEAIVGPYGYRLVELPRHGLGWMLGRAPTEAAFVRSLSR